MANAKITVRPPLAPIGDDAKCREQYEKLRSEYAELVALQVKDVDFCLEKDATVSLGEFNARAAAYDERRTAYNTSFAGLIETRDHVRTNIKEIRRKMDESRTKSKPLQKWFDEKWGDECPLPMPENVDLVVDNPEEWKRQSEECRRRYEEWSADEQKIASCDLEFTTLFSALYAEQCKFEDIQKAADAAFEDMAKRTLADGTVMTDEQLAEYNRTHPGNV